MQCGGYIMSSHGLHPCLHSIHVNVMVHYTFVGLLNGATVVNYSPATPDDNPVNIHPFVK